MGLVNLLIKHRYGIYGLLTYLDMEFALSAGIVLSYDMLFPITRTVRDFRQESMFNLILTLVTIILVVLALRNIPFGIGQDLYDGTIITFVQMKGRKRTFLSLYTVDVIIPALLFIMSSLTVFFLASFSVKLIWILEFLSIYLFLSNISYIITILTKRPFRAFFISIIIIFSFIGAYFSQERGLVFSYPNLLLFSIILLIISYYLFRGSSI